tara:strand:- start:795 stop:947 length:153 start_codon:yes stop_codon:yes gene_type:complete
VEFGKFLIRAIREVLSAENFGARPPDVEVIAIRSILLSSFSVGIGISGIE